MKALVTGGAGFIGSHVVDLLVAEGMDVVVLDNLSTGREANLNPRAKFVRGDICELRPGAPLFQDVDYVFHLAALPRIQPAFDVPVEYEEINVVGTIRVLQAVVGTRIKKLVYSSSSAIYGNTDRIPTPEDTPPDLLNPYALQKYAGERYALILGERFDVPALALRYFNVYGPRSFDEHNRFSAYSSVFGIFNDQKKKGQPLTVTGTGEQRRDCVHVSDVARANLAAALSDRVRDVYNVGCGNNYSIIEIARMFSDNIVHIPERKGEARVTVADISKIKAHLGWAPTVDVRAGLETL